jgi:hypothetical protein
VRLPRLPAKPFSGANPDTPRFLAFKSSTEHEQSTIQHSNLWSIRHRLSPKNQQNGKPHYRWLSAIQSTHRLVWSIGDGQHLSVQAPAE